MDQACKGGGEAVRGGGVVGARLGRGMSLGMVGKGWGGGRPWNGRGVRYGGGRVLQGERDGRQWGDEIKPR